MNEIMETIDKYEKKKSGIESAQPLYDWDSR